MNMKNKIRKVLENNFRKIRASANVESASTLVPKNLVDMLLLAHFQAEVETQQNIFNYKLEGGSLHIAFCFIQGNSLMTTMAIAAAAALAEISNELGLTISVLGMPYKDYCTKNPYLEKHIFKDIRAVIMVYPASVDLLAPSICASTIFEVHYKGRESHASADPQYGINASDALEIAQVAIGKLRQALHPSDKVFSTILKGGDAPNVIPANTVVKYLIRSQTMTDVKKLKRKVMRCLQAGAIASGAKKKVFVKKKISPDIAYNQNILSCYRKNSKVIGRKFADDITIRNILSSWWTAAWLFMLEKMKMDHKDLQPFLLKDFSSRAEISKISLDVPFICPIIDVSRSPESALFDGALAMAWTAIDLATDK